MVEVSSLRGGTSDHCLAHLPACVHVSPVSLTPSNTHTHTPHCLSITGFVCLEYYFVRVLFYLLQGQLNRLQGDLLAAICQDHISIPTWVTQCV